MKRKTVVAAVVCSAGVLHATNAAIAGEFSLGVAAGSQTSLYLDQEDQAFVIPVVGYEGERFSYFLDTAAFVLVGGKLAESDWRMRALATARVFDQPNRRAGLETRHSTVDVGLEVAAQGAWGSLGLELLTDALGDHEGFEVSLAYTYEFAATAEFSISPSIGLSYHDAHLADYYYGVRPSEVRAGRAEYHPEAGGAATAGVTAMYALTPHWSLVGVVEAMVLSDELADSPLIAQEWNTTVVVGALYRFR
jgi:outer membrane protein